MFRHYLPYCLLILYFIVSCFIHSIQRIRIIEDSFARLTHFFLFFRLTKEWPRFKDELDTMKFICTDFWSSIYKKQIDNLRTNHQGVYVLQDNAFRFLTKISNSRQYLEMAPKVMKNKLLLRGSKCLFFLYVFFITTLLSPSATFLLETHLSNFWSPSSCLRNKTSSLSLLLCSSAVGPLEQV